MDNRPKISDVKAGDVLVADAGFDCVPAGPVTIKQDGDGLYFECTSSGRHGLDGQLDFDDQEHLVGLAAKE